MRLFRYRAAMNAAEEFRGWVFDVAPKIKLVDHLERMEDEVPGARMVVDQPPRKADLFGTDLGCLLDRRLGELESAGKVIRHEPTGDDLGFYRLEHARSGLPLLVHVARGPEDFARWVAKYGTEQT